MGSTLTKINCRRIEDGKVKFLTRDEAVTLVSGKRPRENLCISGHHANVADFKPPLISSKAVTPALPSSAGLKSPSRAMKGPAYVGADISSSKKTTEIKRGNRETEVIARVCKMKPDKFKAGADDGCTDKDKETQVTAHACKMKQDKFKAGADDGLTDKHKGMMSGHRGAGSSFGYFCMVPMGIIISDQSGKRGIFKSWCLTHSLHRQLRMWWFNRSNPSQVAFWREGASSASYQSRGGVAQHVAQTISFVRSLSSS
ncbi:hypothetical protein KSP39_PZI005014 [Platanthera zijinensis]|uniref:Uncharacterized protein n=1 Tax=Platanthera zijinensis TaxID=2320716 RepID=A0AAP0GB54_9ASPA